MIHDTPFFERHQPKVPHQDTDAVTETTIHKDTSFPYLVPNQQHKNRQRFLVDEDNVHSKASQESILRQALQVAQHEREQKEYLAQRLYEQQN